MPPACPPNEEMPVMPVPQPEQDPDDVYDQVFDYLMELVHAVVTVEEFEYDIESIVHELTELALNMDDYDEQYDFMDEEEDMEMVQDGFGGYASDEDYEIEEGYIRIVKASMLNIS